MTELTYTANPWTRDRPATTTVAILRIAILAVRLSMQTEVKSRREDKRDEGQSPSKLKAAGVHLIMGRSKKYRALPRLGMGMG